MTYKLAGFWLLLQVVAGNLYAQTGSAKDAGGGKTYQFNFKTEKVKLEFCSATMFRLRLSHGGQFEADEHLMQESYNWPAVMVKATDSKAVLSLATGKIIVKINKSPFKISVYSASGKLISADKGGFAIHGDTVACSKQLLPDEHFFGFGERMDFNDQRNKLLKLNVGRGKSKDNLLGAYNINEANYCPVPFFMSTRGYGIFLHNSFATDWDMGNTTDDEYSFKAHGGELDYYFIYGPDFPAILGRATFL